MICKACLKKVEVLSAEEMKRFSPPIYPFYCPECDQALTEKGVASHATIDYDGIVHFAPLNKG